MSRAIEALDEIERLRAEYDGLLEHDCESMARAAIDRAERDAALAECERLRGFVGGFKWITNLKEAA